MTQRLVDQAALITSFAGQPGFGPTGFWCAIPFSQQWLDARAVFPPQPVRHFPEHNVVDALEYARCVVGELVERSPARQLAVQGSDHVHRGRMMIAGERIDQSPREGLCFHLRYRRDYGHASARSPLTDNSVPKEDEAVVDVGDMGLVH